ncbi:restriction endonuclease subunit S [Blautia sp. RTP21359st1_E11_RTP21359_211015]|uniref:restriction endonuclease subunit S n=1 Tax=Blautia sp. RTP21359st1_E11_RTP21359_211015 TaxID=3141591 RepID=UPI0034A58CBD
MEGKTSEKKERKMRDSGIPWIGEVPEGWEFSKIKYHCTMKSGDNITALDISDNGEYPVYGGNGLRGFYKIYNKNGNHILIGRQGALAGNVHLVNGKFWATDHAVVVTLKNDVFINYFFRMLESMDLNQYAFDTAAQPGLSVSRIMNLNIALPNLEEQHRIADFLDSKCSEIDTLIENLRARMESAKEYKKAAITEAVTKGLNKDAKMKDSGIEWIGEIPEGWKVAKAKYCIEIQNGSDPHLEGNIPVYGSGAKSFKTCGEYKNGPTVLIGRKGATLHIPHYIVGKFWNVDTAFNVYTKPHYLLKYYYYCAVSFDYKSYISQTTLPSMTQTNYENMVLPMPSMLEQQQIVSFLDSKCSEINALLQNYEDQIATLAEYKKSLIYEYVTGKKEVPAA